MPLLPEQCLDKDGYPGTRKNHDPLESWDGGDTAAILGTLVALTHLPEKANWASKLTYMCYGLPLRHPDQEKWYGQKDRFSRDQLIPIICAGIFTDFLLATKTVYEHHRERKFLTAWNTKGNGSIDMPEKFPDITGPEIWALWIRYRKTWWARIALCFLDIETLIGSALWKFRKANRVTRNHMLVCITTRIHMPTITSRLAYWLNDWPDLISRWQQHCEDVGEYQTAELFLKMYRKMEKKKD